MNAATIRLLIEKGLCAADIAEIAESLEQKPARSKAAERQARYRERVKAREEADGVTSDVTRDVTNVTNHPPYSPPNDIYSNPPLDPPNTQKGRAEDFPCPDWCDPAVWRDLKRNRRTKKLTNTPTAHKRFVQQIEAMADDEWPPGRLVQEIAAKGWGGPHDPRNDRKPANDRPQRQPNSNSNALALAREKLGGSW